MLLIDVLAELGAGGTVPGNCHRDLIRRMPGSKMPRHMHPVMVPLKSKLTQEYEQNLDMLLPHVLFAHVHQFYRDVFFYVFGAVCRTFERFLGECIRLVVVEYLS